MDVACLGILVADIFVQPVDCLPAAGELKVSERLLFSPGGCAANVANNLRRLNRSVGVLGKVGQDSLGAFVVSCLREKGVVTDHIQFGARPTSATVILNVCGEDRRYLHCIGANGEFSAADLKLEVLKSARLLYVGGYLAMPTFGPDDLVKVLRYAKNQGLTTVVDVVIPSGTRNARAAVLPILPYTDYFLPNEDEARVLTGEDDVYQQAMTLARSNPGAVLVITRGAQGSIAWQGGKTIETPAFHMQAVDESGAGDAFAAGLILGVLERWPLARVLRFASAVGGSCTRELGCLAGVFGFEEAMTYLSLNDSTFAVRATSRR